jgi:hypothetical protein
MYGRNRPLSFVLCQTTTAVLLIGIHKLKILLTS